MRVRPLLLAIAALVLMLAQAAAVAEENPSVYVAGSYLNLGKNNEAVLWRADKVRRLGDDARAFSVFVSGSDVYVAGEMDDKATLWKNGVAQPLSSKKYTQANSVFVSGGDAYVAGYDKYGGKDVATLWKNGEAQRLGKEEGKANSVFVSGGDVYVAGQEKNEDGRGLATLWKNGVAKRLSGEKSEATCVFVSGCDVYVAGYAKYEKHDKETAALWKNGVAQWLTYANGSRANSVFVSGADVYVAGHEKGVAKLWKNGVAQPLDSGKDKGRAAAESVFVSGGDVYVAGNEVTLEGTYDEDEEDIVGYEWSAAVLWKNGSVVWRYGNKVSGRRARCVFVPGVLK